jgi:deazaflavin-dependent oxidoreductase (nitroreductase family)
MPTPDDMRAFNRLVVREFRANDGAVTEAGGGILKHTRLALLTTIGARSGRPYTTPLGYVPGGPDRALLWASNMGAEYHPQWYWNLCANPHVTLELRTGQGIARWEATATTAEGAERDRLFAMLDADAAYYAEQQRKVEREIPIVVCERLPSFGR